MTAALIAACMVFLGAWGALEDRAEAPAPMVGLCFAVATVAALAAVRDRR